MAKKSLQSQIEELLNGRFCKEVNVHFTFNPGLITSQGTVTAINRYDGYSEEVKATLWFDNYSFFIKIVFMPDKRKSYKPYVSVSFFQETDMSVKQLFRAELDSFPMIEGYNHPQPHWHLTAQLSDHNYGDLGKENEEEEGIFDKLAGNSKSINLDKMHFAQAGSWYCDGNMILDVNADTIISWMIQLFIHVKEELKYKDQFGS